MSETSKTNDDVGTKTERSKVVERFNSLKREWEGIKQRCDTMFECQGRSSKIKPVVEQLDEREHVLMDLLLKIASLTSEDKMDEHQKTIDSYSELFERYSSERKKALQELLGKEQSEKNMMFAEHSSMGNVEGSNRFINSSNTASPFTPLCSSNAVFTSPMRMDASSQREVQDDEDKHSQSTSSSSRIRRDEERDAKMAAEIASFRAELDLAKSRFLIEQRRLQRENDETIQRLSEQLELSNLQNSVDAQNDAMNNFASKEMSKTRSPERNSRLLSTPSRNVSFSLRNDNPRSYLDNWLDSTHGQPGLQEASNSRTETRTSNVFDRVLPSATTAYGLSGNAGRVDNVGATANFYHSSVFDKSIPKLKLATFAGDPLDWPEWSGLFQATIGRSSMSSDEKMSHLKSLVDGPAKRALSGMGYTGALYDAAWRTLEKKFGQPHVIVSSQLNKLNSFYPMRYNDSAALVLFADIVSNFVNVLQQFGYSNDLFSSSNLETAVNKLSLDIKRQWYSHIESPSMRRQIPTLMVFNEWLQEEALVHERLLSNRSNKQNQSKHQGDRNSTHSKKSSQTFAASDLKKTEFSEVQCPIDSQEHKLWQCDKFKKMKTTERYDVVKRNKLCFSCLSNKHQIKDCKARECGVNGCKKHHNRLLHYEVENSKREVAPMTLASNSACATKGLLQVCNVRVHKNDGQFVDSKAILDTGSSHTWIDESFAKNMELSGHDKTIFIAGIHGTSEMHCKVVPIAIGSVYSNEKLEIRANTHKKLDVGNSQYDLKFLKNQYPHLKCIQGDLIDLKNVKVILGQDCFPLIRPIEYKRGPSRSPWAVRTALGWTLSGPLPSDEQEVCTNTTMMLSNDDFKLGEQVRRWWEMESYGTITSTDLRSADDQKALALLEGSVKRKNGRYEVGMLWDNSAPELPNNYVSALSQLKSLETRLSKDETLADQYSKTIEKDLEKGFIRVVNKDELMATKNLKQWYLPHHPVQHPHKPGKVRRVCNAASKFKGISLNDCLLIGPDLLNNLLGVLFRFREHPVAFLADIDAMFMQVLTPEEDQRCLRFLWRDKIGNIIVLQYTRHIFGAKSSPTCVSFVLRRCAIDNAVDYPAASEVILKNFYVDDSPKSVANIETARTLCQDLQQLLAKGGFTLSKWVCNKPGIVPANEGDAQTTDDDHSTTVLGMKWDYNNDTLEVCRGTQCEDKSIWTQRQILSIVSSVFDPIGVISPFVITARIILKSIWETQGQQWDRVVDAGINEKFGAWFAESKNITSVQLPRCYTQDDRTVTSRQLHLFADASQEAFCAVAYLKNEFDGGDVTLSFILGKCRVAPKKFQTIPKLELMAAVIATRLKDLIVKEHTVSFTSITYWSDSSTVLNWISTHHKKHPVFIANRLRDIMDLSSVDQWRHVPSGMNPADLGSRGASSVRQLQDTWLTGPAWLKDESLWPPRLTSKPDDQPLTLLTGVKEPPIDFIRFSKYERLKNTIAWIFFWRSKLHYSTLSLDHLRKAEKAIWRLVQSECFNDEMKCLHKETDWPTSSSISKLSPFLDADGLMRAKGRLRKSDLEYDAKHPIILHKSHHVVKLYLEHFHRAHHHEGVEYLRSLIQREYWIIGLRNALRSIKHQCLECKRVKSANFQPEMADLPVDRVDHKVRPFQHTGVDYFGPFEVTLLRRSMKRWVCLFTCLASRAVHLEIVNSLDTQSCLTAITRFIARRGQPESFLSDNGTNFVGAAKEFKQIFTDTLNDSSLAQKLAQRNIKWSFNPPAAPHFGGSWERLVKSCKKAIYFVLGRQKLTDDVLCTTICIVEQILNNRPLTANSVDVEDAEPITPNHFLLGRKALTFPPVMTAKDSRTSFRRGFRASEAYSQHIWDRRMREYLTQLNQRNKWHRSTTNPRVGDIVWVLDDSHKRGSYPLAKIMKVHYGSDGVCRSAEVKTQFGYYTRPLVKLAPLEIESVFTSENRAGDVGASSI